MAHSSSRAQRFVVTSVTLHTIFMLKVPSVVVLKLYLFLAMFQAHLAVKGHCRVRGGRGGKGDIQVVTERILAPFTSFS